MGVRNGFPTAGDVPAIDGPLSIPEAETLSMLPLACPGCSLKRLFIVAPVLNQTGRGQNEYVASRNQLMTTSLQLIGEITSIIRSKHWKYETNEHEVEVISKFCELLITLNADEQKLFIKLTKKYSYYSWSDYQSLAIRAVSSILTNADQEILQVVVIPLVKPSDLGVGNKAKSGHVLPYVFSNVAIPYHPQLSQCKVTALATPYFDRSKLTPEKILFLIVDDFIGSGQSAEEAAAYVRNKAAPHDEAMIVGLVAMQQGIDRLKALSIPICWAELAPKGIEDNELIEEKHDAYRLIDKIWGELFGCG